MRGRGGAQKVIFRLGAQLFLQFVFAGLADASVDGGGDFAEACDQCRIEMAAGILADDGERLFERHRFLVGAARGQGVEDVDDGENTGVERDGFAAQAAQIARAVEFLVVPLNDLAGAVQPFRLVDDVDAERDMGAHGGEFLLGQLAGLEQDVVADADLADIVQEGAENQLAHGLRIQPPGLAEFDGVEGDAEIVVAGVGVALGDGGAQYRGHFQVALEHFVGKAQDVAIERDDQGVEQDSRGQDGTQHGDEHAPELGAELGERGAIDNEYTFEEAGRAAQLVEEWNQHLDHRVLADGEFFVVVVGVVREGVLEALEFRLDMRVGRIDHFEQALFLAVVDFNDHEIAFDEFAGFPPQQCKFLGAVATAVQTLGGEGVGFARGQRYDGIVDLFDLDEIDDAAGQHGNGQPGQEQSAENDAVD